MKKPLRLLLGIALGLVIGLTSFSHVHSAETLIALGLGEEKTIIPLEEQPFYDQLEIYDSNWDQSYLGKVTGVTPQQTLLRFYAVMARVGEIIRDVSYKADENPGLLWSENTRGEIKEAEVLFGVAKRTLDDSSIPESIRKDTLEESVLKLKEILDYAFTHSREPIDIPNCLLYTSPSPRDPKTSRMPSSA